MRLLEEAQAARDFKRHAAPGEFHLQLHRMKVRSVKHRHFLQRHSFLVKLQDALCYKRRLLPAIRQRDERRAAVRRGSRGAQCFFELLFIRRDGGVGHGENLRRAAVVCLDLVDLRACVALGKFEDVVKVRAPPRVDALRIIADDHDVVVPRGE